MGLPDCMNDSNPATELMIVAAQRLPKKMRDLFVESITGEQSSAPRMTPNKTDPTSDAPMGKIRGVRIDIDESVAVSNESVCRSCDDYKKACGGGRCKQRMVGCGCSDGAVSSFVSVICRVSILGCPSKKHKGG